MAAERALSCGNSKYHMVEAYGYFVVQRQDWFGRTFIGYARDMGEAMALIRSDARSSNIRAA